MMNSNGIRLCAPTLKPWGKDAHKKPVAVLMSGGADSTAACLLLKREGRDVLGITMRIPVLKAADKPSPGLDDNIIAVCRELDVAHYFLDVRSGFEKLVIDGARSAYLRGETPNPCATCNRDIKFGLVWDFLKEEFGVSSLATGHYARILNRDGRSCLARATDRTRDQSYFLYDIPHERMSDLMFPLGEMTKEEVREMIRRAGFAAAESPDSMEICFAGEGDYREALFGGVATSRKGMVIDMSGNVLGRHNGIFNYTVGQRRGIGIAAGVPLYVVAISAVDNTITLGTREEASRKAVRAQHLNALVPEKVQVGRRLLGKIRSVGEAEPCAVTCADKEHIAVEFEDAQFAPTPGQRLVLYDRSDVVVAGGVICREDRFSTEAGRTGCA